MYFPPSSCDVGQVPALARVSVSLFVDGNSNYDGKALLKSDIFQIIIYSLPFQPTSLFDTSW